MWKTPSSCGKLLSIPLRHSDFSRCRLAFSRFCFLWKTVVENRFSVYFALWGTRNRVGQISSGKRPEKNRKKRRGRQTAGGSCHRLCVWARGGRPPLLCTAARAFFARAGATTQAFPFSCGGLRGERGVFPAGGRNTRRAFFARAGAREGGAVQTAAQGQTGTSRFRHANGGGNRASLVHEVSPANHAATHPRSRSGALDGNLSPSSKRARRGKFFSNAPSLFPGSGCRFSEPLRVFWHIRRSRTSENQADNPWQRERPSLWKTLWKTVKNSRKPYPHWVFRCGKLFNYRIRSVFLCNRHRAELWRQLERIFPIRPRTDGAIFLPADAERRTPEPCGGTARPRFFCRFHRPLPFSPCPVAIPIFFCRARRKQKNMGLPHGDGGGLRRRHYECGAGRNSYRAGLDGTASPPGRRVRGVKCAALHRMPGKVWSGRGTPVFRQSAAG